MSRPATLLLPISASLAAPTTLHGSQVTVEVPASVVIIGANGSGKSRLGAWMDVQGPQHKLVHRIAAQKALSFPDRFNPMPLNQAEISLRYGIDMHSSALNDLIRLQRDLDLNTSSIKRSNKWLSAPEVGAMNDFDKLLIYLASEQYETSVNYTQKARQIASRVEPPISKLDRIKELWEKIYPHRQLIIRPGSIGVQVTESPQAPDYQAGSMSDGERVAFYLIGQCLAAAPDSIIVIDEPEIHLHRVVQARLWDEVEQARADCLFVYLTHDLDFATSRTEAKKIWIKSYDGRAWDWQQVPDSEGLPEEVLLAVLGSRKPVLFVEGQRGSLDRVFFSRIYPDWTIMPREGCDQVIEATRAFRSLKHLHGLECYGIVDRDYRTPQQEAELLAKGVHVLDMQEMENLLLIEPVLQLVADLAHAQSMTADTPAEIVHKAKERIFRTLSQNIDLLASRKTAWEMETKLHKIDRKVTGVAKLEQVRNEAAQFDVAGTYAAFEQQLTQILTDQKYAALLRIYNNKGLGEQISLYFGTDSYPGFVKRLISNGKNEAIVAALRVAAPQLPVAVSPVVAMPVAA